LIVFIFSGHYHLVWQGDKAMNKLSRWMLYASMITPLSAGAVPFELDSAAMDGVSASGVMEPIPTILLGTSVSTAQAIGSNATAQAFASGGSASAHAVGAVLNQTYTVALNIKIN
jgi:hypothetical protein